MSIDQLQAIVRSIDRVLRDKDEEIRRAVFAAVSEAMNVHQEELRKETNLRDLGIESLDMLDVTFRLEKRFHIKVPIDIVKDTLARVCGGNCEVNGYLTNDARNGLSMLMPDMGAALKAERPRHTSIVELYTLETLVRLIAWQIADKTERGAATA